MSDKVRSFSRWWGRVYVEKVAVAIGMTLFLFGTILAMVEVFRRYVFGVSFMWQQDIVVVSLLPAFHFTSLSPSGSAATFRLPRCRSILHARRLPAGCALSRSSTRSVISGPVCSSYLC